MSGERPALFTRIHSADSSVAIRSQSSQALLEPGNIPVVPVLQSRAALITKVHTTDQSMASRQWVGSWFNQNIKPQPPPLGPSIIYPINPWTALNAQTSQVRPPISVIPIPANVQLRAPTFTRIDQKLGQLGFVVPANLNLLSTHPFAPSQSSLSLPTIKYKTLQTYEGYRDIVLLVYSLNDDVVVTMIL